MLKTLTHPYAPDWYKGQQGDQGFQGRTGPEGPLGPQGIPGPVGPQGVQGVKGDTGHVGTQGPPGRPGVTFSVAGIVADEDHLPSTGGSPNDLWITSDTNEGWIWDGEKWVNMGPVLLGPEGPQGPPGSFVIVQPDPPTNIVQNGTLWFNMRDGQLYMWYVTVSSSSWIAIGPYQSDD